METPQKKPEAKDVEALLFHILSSLSNVSVPTDPHHPLTAALLLALVEATAFI